MKSYVAVNRELIDSIESYRSDDGHKGTFGTALLVAGSKYMTGAQVLATSSCLRSGIGITRVFAEDEALIPTKINCPCAVTSAYSSKLEDTLRDFISTSKKCTSVGIGPGLEINRINEAILETAIATSSKLVIDASCLTIIANNKERFFDLLNSRVIENKEKAILTPHVGEFSRLINKDLHEVTFDDMVELAKDFAAKTSSIVVLKSSSTIITDGTSTYVYEGKNSGMAKGGSGDVLMGLIAGFLGSGMDAISASCAGCYFHGFAGEIASKKLGKRAMLPTDVIDSLGEAFGVNGW